MAAQGYDSVCHRRTRQGERIATTTRAEARLQGCLPSGKYPHIVRVRPSCRTTGATENAGGDNAISGLGFLKFARKYKFSNFQWENNLELRYTNEPARHKLLDIIGDLALVGKVIKGHIIAKKPGHGPNTAFAKYITTLTNKNMTPKYDLSKKPVMDIVDIMNTLPHRPPFLLVDKVLELSETHVVGLKNITMNEDFFNGHFPGSPVMPGVLQVEAMAQAGGILVLKQVPDPENYLTYFLKMDAVKFKHKVVPGDTLILKMQLMSPIRRGIVQMQATAYVGNKIVSEGELTAQIVKRTK